MLVVNLCAGPGAGKSTIAAGLFSALKLQGCNVELVTEFAKDLTWEGRKDALECAPYVLGRQLHRMHRLRGKVDAVITDSPLLLNSVFSSNMPATYHDFVLWQFNQFQNLNIYVHRVKPYVTAGRNQTETEARAVDDAVHNILHTAGLDHLHVEGNMFAVDFLATYIKTFYL